MTDPILARSRFRRMLFATAPALLVGLAVATAGAALAASSSAELTPGPALAFKQPTRTPEIVRARTDSYPPAADEDLGPLLTPSGPKRLAYLRNYVFDSMIVARLAKRSKLDQAPGFGQRLEYEKTEALDRGLLSKVAAAAASDAVMRAAAEMAQSDLLLELRKTAKIERTTLASKN